MLAPMAGGPSTPELAAAVCEAGGLGFLAAGYLTADQVRAQITAARRLTQRPLGLNVFVPALATPDAALVQRYAERVGQWAAAHDAAVGEPRPSDDDWAAKIELLTSDPIDVVSFTFGCPDRELIARLRSAGSAVWITVTSPDEAVEAAAAGADALVVQGAEAGGHRASFVDRPDLPTYGLLALLSLVRAAVDVPLVASGGIGTGRALAAALCAGAAAAQLGTAFMLAPEAGTVAAHRRALKSARPTGLTRAFTGRLARGIRNDFMAAHDDSAPLAYPEVHYLTAPLRRTARERGDIEAINLWAGEAYPLARELPAGEIVRWLLHEASAGADAVARRLGSREPPHRSW